MDPYNNHYIIPILTPIVVPMFTPPLPLRYPQVTADFRHVGILLAIFSPRLEARGTLRRKPHLPARIVPLLGLYRGDGKENGNYYMIIGYMLAL